MQPEASDIIVAVVFAMVYGIRLVYQGYLLRHRDKSGKRGEWDELLLVVIPKNLLVLFTIWLLVNGIQRNMFFFLGWVIFLIGIVLRIWALRQMGPMYSLNVEIRAQHNLLTSGIFGLVRHPLYVAYIIDTVGVLFFLQKLYLIPVLFCVVVGWAIRIRNEETALRRAFGKAYDEYAAKVPSVNIIAGFWRKLHPPSRPGNSTIKNILTQGGNTMGQSNSKKDKTLPRSLTGREKSELEVHLAEYRALSDFQRDAKSSFVRIAMYHNTGIVVVCTWILKQLGTSDGLVSSLVASSYLLPLLLALPIVNAVLIVAVAYQVYSFFCVARHFQYLRIRLSELVATDVLAYEDKFRTLIDREKPLSLSLDVIAATMWFVIPLGLAVGIAIGAPIWLPLESAEACSAYWIGSVASAIAVIYLVGVIRLLVRTGTNGCKSPKVDDVLGSNANKS